MKTLAIIGTGGFGKQVLPLANELTGAEMSIVFAETAPAGRIFGGLPLVAINQLDKGSDFVVAIADAKTRADLVSEIESIGMSSGRLVSPDAKIASNVDISDGAVICDFVVIEPFTTIGRHFHANVFSFVAHECIVGDYVTLGPRATCNGNVHIGDRAYIGAGAVIRQGTPEKPLRIGAGAIVGMGAIVTKDVPAGATVVGNPARPLSSS